MNATKKERRLKSYHFDIGNSTTGHIGMCGRIIARSKRQAVKRFRELVAQDIPASWDDDEMEEGEYINVYVNPDVITAKDIEEWEYEDE